jgi:hypothetical protein
LPRERRARRPVASETSLTAGLASSRHATVSSGKQASDQSRYAGDVGGGEGGIRAESDERTRVAQSLDPPADPAILFVIALAIVWIASALLAPLQFTEIDPRNGMPIRVANQLTGTRWLTFSQTWSPYS